MVPSPEVKILSPLAQNFLLQGGFSAATPRPRSSVCGVSATTPNAVERAIQALLDFKLKFSRFNKCQKVYSIYFIVT
jgi:hypothetical protein